MIRFANTEVLNLHNAIRGARNPKNSWERSDSRFDEAGDYILGENDLDLAKRLRMAGSDHRKFMRQIFVSVDIAAPLYWWKEFDTYKVGTVANSTSTMHKLHAKPIEVRDFSLDLLDEPSKKVMESLIAHLEAERKLYLQTKDKGHWWNLIQLLPSSYNQMRTVTMTYENLINMYHARKNHKLDEWRKYCEWVGTLPYASELIIGAAYGKD